MAESTLPAESIAPDPQMAEPITSATIMAEPIKLELIQESKTNPRTHFDKEQLEELARSIKQYGVLQPVLVRPLTNGKTGYYELVYGSRRLRAARIAHLESIPAIIKNYSDKEVLEIQVIENLQRSDLSPMEEAYGYDTLIKTHGYTAAALAAKIGKSPSYVARRAKLTELSDHAQKLLAEDKMPLGHALLLARLADHKLQNQAIDSWQNWNGWCSLEAAERTLRDNFMLKLVDAPFDIKSEDLLPAAGSCTNCPHRTGNQKELFQDAKGPDLCTKPTCHQEKVQIWWKGKVANAATSGDIIMPASDVKKEFDHGSLRYNSSYVSAEAGCYQHPKQDRYGKIIGDRIKPIHALVGGRMFKLYDRKDVDKLLRTEKWYKTERASSQSYSSPKRTAAEEKKSGVNAIINGRIRAAFASMKIPKMEDLFKTFILGGTSYEIVKHLPKLSGSEKRSVSRDDGRLVADYMKTATHESNVRVVTSWLLLEGASISQYGHNEKRQAIILKLFGLDPVRMQKDAEKEYAAKRAAKKVSKAKKPKPTAKKKGKGVKA